MSLRSNLVFVIEGFVNFHGEWIKCGTPDMALSISGGRRER